MKDKVSLATLTLAKAYTDEQGGGGGGTSNYNDLTHKPTVNGVEFKGTMTSETLGLVDAEDGKGLSTNDYTDADKSIVGGVTSALAGKVDKVSGKGLSTNDYDDSAKAVVDGVTTALNGKVDKVSGKGLSTNDYSDADKTIVDGVTSALNEKADKTETYLVNDAAEVSLTDNDKFPFYDISVTATKHSTWSNIKSKLKTYFDTLYAAVSSVYTKTETDGMINTAQDGIKANTQLIEDTVGWSGKNEFEPSTPSNQTHGVTATITNDKRVSLTGTSDTAHVLSIGDFDCKANVKYVLSGCPSGGGTESSNYWLDAYIVATSTIVNKDTGSGCELLFNADTTVRIRIRIPNGLNTAGMVFSPMVRKANILDGTYEPHRGTTAFPRDEQAILGTKNLLPNIATGKTESGVTITTNANGEIIFNGTPSSTVQQRVFVGLSKFKGIGKLTLNGCPIGGSSTKYELVIRNSDGDSLAIDGNTNNRARDFGEGVTVDFNTLTNPDGTTPNLDTCYISALIRTGAGTVTNLTFKPMVRLASDTDATYQPHAMTNKELTLALDGKLDKINGVFDDTAEPIVGDIYNSEEQVVGTWGKQGHEKTLYMSALMSEGNIPFNTENSEILEVESHNIANIDEIVFAQFTCKPSSANVWSPLPHKKKYITIDRTDIIGYTSNSSNEQAAIKGLVYYTKTS